MHPGALSVSVIIPSEGRRPTSLSRAIDSVRRQRRGAHVSEVELIVSHNSSGSIPDAVRALCERGEVRVIDSSSKRGVSFARNEGARGARFEVLAFLDDDDWWSESYLEEACGTMINRGVDLVACGSWIHSGGARRRHQRRPGLRSTDTLSVQALYTRNPGLTGSNLLVRAGAYRALGGFNEELATSNDKDFMIRFLRDGRFRVAINEQALVHEDRSPHPQLSQPTKDRVLGMRRFLALHEEDMTPESRAEYQYKLALCEALSDRSYSGVVRLLPRHPTKAPQLLGCLRKMLMGGHIRM